MTGQRTVALIAGHTPNDERVEQTLSAAIAVVRAVLERGGRVLLATDASMMVPLLLAASEYLAESAVESTEATPATPVTLAPFYPGDTLEDRLLEFRPEPATEWAESTSLIEDLVAVGLVARTTTDPDHPQDPRSGFQDLLDEMAPAGILAVGQSPMTESFVEAAGSYRGDAEPQLWRVLRADRQDLRGRWRLLEREDEKMPPPMLEGRVIGDREAGSEGDERLWILASRATQEAGLALAIDRLVGTLLGTDNDAGRP